MLTHPDVPRRHSPAVWGLLAVLGAFAVEVVAVAAWNGWEHRAELRAWLKL